MKRLSGLVVAIILFTTVSASAFAPIVIPALALASGAVIAASLHFSGLYYYMKNGIPGLVSPAGKVSRPSNVTYVDVVGSIPELKTKDVTAQMEFSKAQQLAAKKKTDNTPLYPKVDSAMTSVAPGYTPKVNDILNANLAGLTPGNYRVTDIAWNSPSCVSFVPATTYSGGKIVAYINGTHTCSGNDHALNYMGLSIASTTSPNVAIVTSSQIGVKTSATAAEFKSRVAPSGTVSDSALQAELDKMFQDPDYVPAFTDDTTGLPYSPPPDTSIASPEKLAAYNAKGAAAEAQQAAINSSQNAATSAGNAATQAGNAYAASGGNPATGVGGDPKLYQDYLNAKAKADEAQAALDKLKSDQATDDAEQAEDDSVTAPGVPGDNAYDSSVTAPDKKSITDLLTGFLSSSPIVSMIQSFNISTSDASGVVPIGTIYGQQLSFDFTRWESTLRACGGVLIIIMHGFAVFIVVRGW